MAASLQWTEPLAVRQRQWQTKDVPQIKTFLRLFGKWLLLLGVPILVAVYHFIPTELPRVGLSFLAFGIVQPLGGIAHVWVLRKECARYSVEAKGLRRRAGHGGILYRWQDVEGYRIVKHPQLSGVGVLEFKVRRFGRLRQWSFNASQLPEQELRRALERHIPQSSLRTFDMSQGQPAA